MEAFEGSFKSLNGFDLDVGRADPIFELDNKKFEIRIRHNDADIIYALYEKLSEMVRDG